MTEPGEENLPANDLFSKASEHINLLFKEQLSQRHLFHNYQHTLDVVTASKELAEGSDISEEELEVLLLAAWFHDTGMVDNYENHEEASATRAEKFLKEQNFPEDKIKKVKSIILSTKVEYVPQNLLEEMLHDADIAHIGKKDFFRKGELLRVETEHFENKTFSELDWQKNQYDFLISNDFITHAGQLLYEKRRAKNIRKQRDNIHKARKVTTRKKTGKDFGRGIDTLYRANYRNHINLSAIADGKANMMISINTIILSVIVTLSGASMSLSQGLSIANLRFVMPILILLLGCLASVVFAIISARPKVTEKEIDMDEVKNNKASILYFGNFLRIPREDFVMHLRQLKQDQKLLYDSMSMDLYSLGIVLKEKYRLLKTSYNLFMVGLVASVLTFIFIFFYTNSQV